MVEVNYIIVNMKYTPDRTMKEALCLKYRLLIS